MSRKIVVPPVLGDIDFSGYLRLFIESNIKAGIPMSVGFLSRRIGWSSSLIKSLLTGNRKLTLRRAIEFAAFANFDLFYIEQLCKLAMAPKYPPVMPNQLIKSCRWRTDSLRRFSKIKVLSDDFHGARKAFRGRSADNRRLERVEIYDSDRKSYWMVCAGYYLQLLGGLYFVYLLTAMILSLSARLREPVLNTVFKYYPLLKESRSLLQVGTLREIRIDTLLILSFYGLSAFLFLKEGLKEGTLWVFFGILDVRGFLWSFLDYIYHYYSPLTNHLHGYNLSLPRALSKWILHFNYHGVHHRYPKVPWRELPKQYSLMDQKMEGSYLRFALRQLWGPLALRRFEGPRLEKEAA